MALRSLAVFTGSRTGSLEEYSEAADLVGRKIAERGWRLVYGGGRAGLMGILADAALAAGGEVFGVIPKFLADKEVAHEGLTSLELVETMDERKLRFEALADGFLALPGGFGTLDELFEVLTGAQLHRHSKPIGLLNTEYYFDPLLGVAEKMLLEGFVRPEHLGLLLTATNIDVLLDDMDAYQPAVSANKWD